ncbi:formate dehydrogenase subunit alpha [Rhodospirillum rubrum]|uniref:Formate dehydrogenase alpha subunit n=1 Tax=Rhodospirillum rubrum (strain ATCC 11170 / ATH 1.1.1 / DSM 467 / LMG 4362 / NCIMB 8255 / S1) TaxID=269796 RepID=Q2RXL6_RHORT|nr:formate dehydrogenase subunit alpha [Rhodospirillum rubrum]ABC21129.1 formate dehydrogenase alpha subunit [Rhodospirillum rubrum ATCC 11170]AEO46797.1 formate dehydrogenase subunit alpha [Rhodospirillum rubrum F11]MBK5952676.1 formate dehydrogenase subunit alpha [Rhodospirillum rubrum]QXG80821.1 formate dehydrogenase subunit alpha [Rhodospirillum rubrum]HAP98574.1 formate dehydrogenase subunit alpha [Rhodospirillum rubrum]
MEKVLTVCPYCGSGCKINLLVENDQVIGAEPAQGVTNQGELCLKGYYGWDFLNDPKLLTPRLRKPLIRRTRDSAFEEVSWYEAINFAATRLQEIKHKYGPDSIMLTGSARGPGNEANYVMQKFARAVVGTNNIDHCARVCHGPSVAGLQVTLGNGAMSNSVEEIENTKCVFVFGYNAAVSHPIVARRILKAKEKGAKIIVCDPRFIETARIADLWLPLKNGTNMALVNAFAHVLLEENLYDKDFVAKYTEGLDDYKATVAKYTPEYAEKITGVPAQQIREAMRMYAGAETATVMWGMGVTQWSQAVDVVKGLSGLALLTGNLGKPSCGVAPVRGQNNVQGACDHGALPNMLPGYQPVTDAAARAKFEKAWGVSNLPDKPGVCLTEVPKMVKAGKLKAYYIFGEDPAQTDPDLHEVRESMRDLEFVICQEIFMTKTAMMADVVFPATSWGEHEGVYSSCDRGFQRFYKAIEPQGDVKPDWEIISLMATAMGYPMKYSNTQEIWDELRELCPIYYGATYEKMAGLGYIQWPCPDLDHPGTPYLYADKKFQTPSGKGLLFACEWRPPMEKVDAAYPLILSTVREVGHYSCRTMTGNCHALQTLADEPGYISMHSKDAKALGISDQHLVSISSRRGKIIARADIDDRINEGAVYMTYQWWVGACNELTAEHLDPISKTPEYKYSAVKVEAIADQAWAENHVQEVYSQLKADLANAVA